MNHLGSRHVNIVYLEAERWLMGTERLGSKPGLEVVSRLLEMMGSPQESFRAIHVTGTNGKGSTAAMAASILSAAGHRVGLFTSPHLSTFRESIAVDGTPIPRERAASIIERIKPMTAEMEATPGLRHPTYFELLTAIAFEHFRHERVDLAVVEVGMGGRLDATNVINAPVSIITNVSLEHTRWLGSTVLEIAENKAGIIKQGGTLITATQDDSVYALLQRICAERNSRVFRVGSDITYEKEASGQKGQNFMVKGLRGSYDLFIPLLGDHQLLNASTAVGAVEALSLRDVSVPVQAYTEGLRRVRWPGRLEIVARNPTVVLDGAKDAEAARAAIDAVEQVFNPAHVVAVVSISSDKNIPAMMDQFARVADRFIATSHMIAGRAADPAIIAAEAERLSRPCEVVPDVGRAIEVAKELAGEEGIVLIIGSVFLVGEAREKLLGPPA